MSVLSPQANVQYSFLCCSLSKNKFYTLPFILACCCVKKYKLTDRTRYQMGITSRWVSCQHAHVSAAVKDLVVVKIWQAILTDAMDMLWDCSQLQSWPSSPAAFGNVSDKNSVLFLFCFFPRCSTC